MYRSAGAGNAMHAGAPLSARSNELSSGPSSSQPARRRGREVLGGTAEKSGARNGFASCREITGWGTTRRSVPGGAAADCVGAISSGAGSIPNARSISRRSDRGRLGDDGVLGEQSEETSVADCGRREDGCDVV